MNKRAVVTGGSRNIGQGIAITLAKKGYDLAITYATNPDGANETKRQIEEFGRRCFVYEAHLDLCDEPAKLMANVYRDLGGIDVLVCNAGKDRRHSVLTITSEDMDFLYNNTIRNYFLCISAAAKYMVRDDTKGSIIVISSVRGELAHPDDFFYGAMKAGLNRAVESLALELSQYNIRINSVAPGAIWPTRSGEAPNSPFIKNSIPLHRTGTPEDIGEAVAYLADNELSGYVTGITLTVDGGLKLPGMWEKYEAVDWVNKDWLSRTRDKAIKILEESEKNYD